MFIVYTSIFLFTVSGYFTSIKTLVNSPPAAACAGDRGAVAIHWSQPSGLDPGISVLMNTGPHLQGVPKK